MAEGQKYHLRVVFSDGSLHDSTRIGAPDVTIVFHNRRAEWRMAFGGAFEFLESYFEGDVDIVGEHGLRRLIDLGYRKPFGRFEHPWTHLKRRILEWRQNNRSFARARRNAAFHYGLPAELFHLVLGSTYGYNEGFWTEGTRTLDEAQHENFDRICRKLTIAAPWSSGSRISKRSGRGSGRSIRSASTRNSAGRGCSIWEARRKRSRRRAR